MDSAPGRSNLMHVHTLRIAQLKLQKRSSWTPSWALVFSNTIFPRNWHSDWKYNLSEVCPGSCFEQPGFIPCPTDQFCLCTTLQWCWQNSLWHIRKPNSIREQIQVKITQKNKCYFELSSLPPSSLFYSSVTAEGISRRIWINRDQQRGLF